MAVLRKRVASPSQEPIDNSSSEIGAASARCQSLSASIKTGRTASFTNEHEHEHEHEHEYLPEYSGLEEDATLQEQKQEQPSPSAIGPISQPMSTGEIKTGYYTYSLFLDQPATWYWVKRKQHLSDAAVNALAN
jgi:hypothetical protein